MNRQIFHTNRFSSRFEPERRSGIALVLVLGFLVLISALILSFFSNVQTDLQSAKTYAHGVTVRQLADSATNIVMGQIVDGTKTFEVPKTAPSKDNPRVTWSSQPGLIRTWRDTGKPGRSFKLYSSKNMVVQPGTDAYNVLKELDTEVPQSWVKQPAHYTDLNSPVLVPDDEGLISRGQVKYAANYPILDPLSLDAVGGPGSVEGFSMDGTPPGYGGAATIAPATDPTIPINGQTGNPAPMPVVWFYVLKDGTVTVPNAAGGSTTTAEWPGTGAFVPSEANPIVGRVAFWTDDETCKVNVNTAAEGVFWDRPWAEGSQERNYAADIPAQNEFQRYTGHPAMTSLSAVFNRVPGMQVTTGTPTWAQVSPYYDILSPRVKNGGTKAGTTVATQAIPLKDERLYTSIDELVFRVNSAVTGRPATADTTATKGLTRSVLEKAKFFLTASSRAPEVNAFNLPRVSLWPLQANVRLGIAPLSQAANVSTKPEEAINRNPKDRLIAFCTSTNQGKIPYYFQRYTIYDRTKDGRGTPQVPPPSSYRSDLDFFPSQIAGAGIPRNKELYEYLQRLTQGGSSGFGNIPGVGKNFLDKYPGTETAGLQTVSDRDQILTSMFDTIRGGINSYSTGGGQNDENYDYAPSRGSPRPGETQVVPFFHPTNGTMGFGRFATITEAALIFYCSKGKPDAKGVFIPEEMRALLVLEPFNPSIGPASWSHHVRYVVKGLERLQIEVIGGGTSELQSLNFLPEVQNLVTSRVGYSGGGHTTAMMGLQSFFRYYDDGGNDKRKVVFGGAGRALAESNYQLVGAPVKNLIGKKFRFQSTPEPISIEIWTGYPGAGQDILVQKIDIIFPKMESPMDLPNDREVDFDKRLADNNQQGNQRSMRPDYRDWLIRPGDVVRSVEANTLQPHKGDLRFFSARRVVPPTYFSPAHGPLIYGDPNSRIVHSLRQTCWTNEQVYVDYYTRPNKGGQVKGRSRPTGYGGSLVAGVTYDDNVTPVVPRSLVAASGLDGPGDWDNGVGGLEDGPYINKPDEGNVATGQDSYFGRGRFDIETGVTFSPNRQVSSGVVFGSLPTGIYSARPWQTLCFTPYPAAGSSHIGLKSPADHHFLDLFTMPIVEPYAISEPFSTAGKVNLNYQIAPFSYINRDTALRAALKSTLVMAIPTSAGKSYKSQGGGGAFRKPLNLNETMKAFKERLFTIDSTKHKPFIAASEICEMPLVPVGTTLQNISAFWNSNKLTGDNTREYPYGHIYPRVTTKSNSFTVHMRVQALSKSRPSSSLTKSLRVAHWTKWDESKDTILSEYRGATLVERYIDAADKLPDFATADSDATLDEFYKFRVVSQKKFAP